MEWVGCAPAIPRTPPHHPLRALRFARQPKRTPGASRGRKATDPAHARVAGDRRVACRANRTVCLVRRRWSVAARRLSGAHRLLTGFAHCARTEDQAAVPARRKAHRHGGRREADSRGSTNAHPARAGVAKPRIPGKGMAGLPDHRPAFVRRCRSRETHTRRKPASQSRRMPQGMAGLPRVESGADHRSRTSESTTQ